MSKETKPEPKQVIAIDQEEQRALARAGVEADIGGKNRKKTLKAYLSKGQVRVVLNSGKTAEFENCLFETDDEELQKELEADKRFGVEYFWHKAYVNKDWTGKAGTPASEILKEFDFAWKNRLEEMKKRRDMAAEFDEAAHPRDGVEDEAPLSGHPGVVMKVEKKKQPEV